MLDGHRLSPRLFMALLALWLAGCTPLLPSPEPVPSRFDLGPLLESKASPARTIPAIRLQSVRAPSWLDGTGIPYRQLHRRPEAVQHYAAHSWIAPPAEMLRVRLETMLLLDGEASERWRLDVELLRFEQVFVSTHEAEATILFKATLRQRGGTDEVRQRTFAATMPVTAGVDGAIDGLPKVAATALNDFSVWAVEVTELR